MRLAQLRPASRNFFMCLLRRLCPAFAGAIADLVGKLLRLLL